MTDTSYPIELAKRPVVEYSISVDVYQHRVFVKVNEIAGKWLAISMSPEDAMDLANSLTLAVMEAKL